MHLLGHASTCARVHFSRAHAHERVRQPAGHAGCTSSGTFRPHCLNWPQVTCFHPTKQVVSRNHFSCILSSDFSFDRRDSQAGNPNQCSRTIFSAFSSPWTLSPLPPSFWTSHGCTSGHLLAFAHAVVSTLFHCSPQWMPCCFTLDVSNVQHIFPKSQ